MSVTVNYFGQLRQFAGVESEPVDVSGEATVQGVLTDLAGRHGEKFGNVLFAEGGGLRPSVMVLVNDAPINKAEPRALADGDRVNLLAAIAGG